MRCVWRGGPDDGQAVEIPQQAEIRGGVLIPCPSFLSMLDTDSEPLLIPNIEAEFVPIVRTKTCNYLDWNQRRKA
jgi:hypothetical protein